MPIGVEVDSRNLTGVHETMILWTNIEISPVALWEHAARAFGYVCPDCRERPGYEDAASFLAVGRCGCCATKSVALAGADPSEG
jgi:hypothetical protein